jgi:hypothetical protein
MRRTVQGLTALLAGAALLLPALATARPSAARAESGEVMALPTPEAAVQAAVEATGESYAGDCNQTVSPRDIGKVCTRYVGERAGTRAYLAGRTFSEFSRWVFVTSAGAGAWRVAGVAPLDFFGPPEPPWPAEEQGMTAVSLAKLV